MRGLFHQADERFGERAGTQCMCKLYAFGYSTIKKMRPLKTWDIDYGSLGFRTQLPTVDKLSISICVESMPVTIAETNLVTN